jgi:ATP dependent DNA ligase C terminal region
LSRVHWVRPELVAEVKYLTWTDDNLLRQVVYQGLREDKPAAEVRRPTPYPKPLSNPRARHPGQGGCGPADRRRRPARRTSFHGRRHNRALARILSPVRLLSIRPPGP